MQITRVLKGLFVFILTLSIAFSNVIASMHKTGRAINKKVNRSRHLTTSSAYANPFLGKCYAEASKRCRQTQRYITSSKPSTYSLKVRRKKTYGITINVRIYKPWDPLHSRIPLTRINNGKTFDKLQQQQPELESIKSFQHSLGQNAALISDADGRVIGITLIDAPNLQITRLDSQGRRGRIFIYGDDNQLMSSQPRTRNQDQCCETKESFYMNTTLVDVRGKKHTIRQYPHSNSHQFIRHGFCSGGQGLCRAQCVQTYIHMSLSIHPPNKGEKASYKFFKIPGYCSCKSFG